jgi:hypothetical protein
MEVYMNLQKLTLKAQEAVQAAREIAESMAIKQSSQFILFAAMVQDASGIIPDILAKWGLISLF